MSFITNLFNSSTNTHEDLDKFINKKFVYYLNNSNLLLNFVSDFEDFKNNGRNDNKSKCDECESLYILTSEIFENYINRVKIPMNVNIYNEGKEKKGINYKNKVLYFFDLKDLNKILQTKNLARSDEEDRLLNKKRILCKVISLSFIKIYIIIKSIFQTFNIYNSLIKNKNTLENSESSTEEQNTGLDAIPYTVKDAVPYANSVKDVVPDTDANPVTDAVPVTDTNPDTHANPDTDTNLVTDTNPVPDAVPGVNPYAVPGANPDANIDPVKQEKVIPVGGGLFDLFNFNSFPKETQDLEIEPQRAIKLQTSENVFYSIFVILFEDTEYELTAKNFTANYLTSKLDTITKEQLDRKLPDILKYICSTKLYESDFISKSSIIFNSNNFTFLKIKTSDALESKTAESYLKEIDEKYEQKIMNNIKKLAESENNFKKENKEFIANYCINKKNLSNLNILNSVKNILRTLITNYFKNRNNLYDSIIKKLIKFNPRTNEIENINPALTYVKIVELTEETKSIILDLYSNIFKSLNSIVIEIKRRLVHKYGNKLDADNIEQPTISGGKTRRKYYKKYYKKNRKYTRK